MILVPLCFVFDQLHLFFDSENLELISTWWESLLRICNSTLKFHLYANMSNWGFTQLYDFKCRSLFINLFALFTFPNSCWKINLIFFLKILLMKIMSFSSHSSHYSQSKNRPQTAVVNSFRKRNDMF